MIDKGVSAAKGVVSGVAVEQQPFMKGFARLCADGWDQGWHERNGGNLTYRMTEGEVADCRPFFCENPSNWIPLGVQADNLRGAFFAATGAGCYLRNVALDIARNVGIVEINASGDACRVVWGLKDGGRPTSEFPSHFMIHSVRLDATGGASRILYHAHPTNVVALTSVMPLDARAITRALWKAMTECIIAFPKGVGVVPWMVPGGSEIAMATAKLMGTARSVLLGCRFRFRVRSHAHHREGGGYLCEGAPAQRGRRFCEHHIRRRASRHRPGFEAGCKRDVPRLGFFQPGFGTQ